jgi:hypothetical protein
VVSSKCNGEIKPKARPEVFTEGYAKKKNDEIASFLAMTKNKTPDSRLKVEQSEAKPESVARTDRSFSEKAKLR